MKKFFSLCLVGTMLLSVPVCANTNYTNYINQVKSIFNVPDSVKFEINDEGDGLIFSWEDSKGGFVNASLKDGVITSYVNFIADEHKNTENKSTLTEKQIKESAEKVLNAVLGSDFKNRKVKSTNSTDGDTTFVYTKYIGNYPVNDDLVSVSVSNYDGKITQYSKSLNQSPNIVAPKNIISETDAKNMYLKNSNFGAWYTEYSDTPIFTYTSATFHNDIGGGDNFFVSNEFPCIDAETGEFFYGTGCVDSLTSLYSGSYSVEKRDSNATSQDITEQFISTEEAVKIVNSKLNTAFTANNFKLATLFSDGKTKSAYFYNTDTDNRYTSFTITDKNAVSMFTNYKANATTLGKSNIDVSKKADEILTKNGFNVPDFCKLVLDDEVRYYQKIDGIPCTTSYIDICFDSNGEVSVYSDDMQNNAQLTKTNPSISKDRAFDIANTKCKFEPVYVQSYNDGKYHLAYCFRYKPMVSYDGTLLTENGKTYYENNQIYADIQNAEDRAVVLNLSELGYNFEDLTKFEPDKAVTLNDFITYSNLGKEEALKAVNKYLNTSYTEKDGNTPLTVKQIITVIENLKFNGDLTLLNSAFKNQDNDVYTNIALSMGLIQKADDVQNNATRMAMADYIYKIMYAK